MGEVLGYRVGCLCGELLQKEYKGLEGKTTLDNLRGQAIKYYEAHLRMNFAEPAIREGEDTGEKRYLDIRNIEHRITLIEVF